jgi:hypothetical protein
MGTINISGYAIIESGAENLSRDFDKHELMPAFKLSLLLFRALVLVVIARWFVVARHLNRIILATVLMIFSFILLGICCLNKDHVIFFYLALFASVIQGAGSALGESTVFGYLKGFPKGLIGFFTAGLGFGGFFGSFMLLVFKYGKVEDYLTYLCSAPFFLLYLICFYWLYKQH